MKTLKKELTPLVLFLASVIIFGALSILGMIYNLGKAVYSCFCLKFWEAVFSFVLYWLQVLYQFWNVIKYFLMKIAIGIDIFGNVASGEMIEDLVTAKENTLFANGESTISAATGKLEIEGSLNSKGIFFTNLLNKVLGNKHCIAAYEKELRNKIEV